MNVIGRDEQGAPPPKRRDIYSATVKHFGSQPEPAFDDPDRMREVWGEVWGCDNDYGTLRSVLVHRPGAEFDIVDPSKRIPETGGFGDIDAGWYWQSDEIPALEEMQAQHDGLTALLRAEGVDVIEVGPVSGGRFKTCYTRDSSISVKGGSIICRLAPRLRHGEERDVARILSGKGVPIIATVVGTGMMEGGSFAWIDPRTAVVGRGIRVNDAAIGQLADVLRWQGVDLVIVDLPAYSIHLDGWFVMLDRDLALIDPAGLPYGFLELLRARGVRTIEITAEDNGWIINGLALAPRRYVMPEGVSADTRAELANCGVEMIELPFDRMHLNGGGIHCSTCPLRRDSD